MAVRETSAAAFMGFANRRLNWENPGSLGGVLGPHSIDFATISAHAFILTRLPTRRLCEKAVGQRSRSVAGTVMNDPSIPSTITVLFIDPNEEERQKWAEQLTICSSEYVVLQAASGESGLKLFRSEPIDCVVLELDLPDRNGLSILLDFVAYAYSPRMAVVVLTTFPLETLCQIAIRNGAQSCWLKDKTSVEELDLAIRRAIAVVGPHKHRIA